MVLLPPNQPCRRQRRRQTRTHTRFQIAPRSRQSVLHLSTDSCTEKRIRKSWDAFTPEEKELYLGAVERAMDLGYHYRFTAIHADQMNVWHAHNTCGFLLWHRRFLLAYEKMLRSLEPKFACVTLPFWNYFEDSTKQLATKTPCNTIESCSTFLQDFGGGGTTDGELGNPITIADITVPWGSCVSKGIAAHACSQTNGKASGKCEGCILRGWWSNHSSIIETVGPDFLAVLNVYNETTAGQDAHTLLSSKIENKFHNAVHGALGGTMMSMASPADPVVFGHHTTIDMALFIFNRCQYDPTGKLDMDTNPRNTTYDVFGSCAVNNDFNERIGQLDHDADVYMMLNKATVAQSTDTKQFFEGMGTKYQDFADAENLGELSYAYKLGPYLKNLLEAHHVKCPSSVWATPPTNKPSASPTPTPTVAPTTEPTKKPRRTPNPSSWDFDAIDDDSAFDLEEDDASKDAALEVMLVLAECGEELAAANPEMTYSERLEQEGALKCDAIRRKKGPFSDYTPEFRASFRIPLEVKPYCFELMERVDSNQLHIRVNDRCKQRYGELMGVSLV